MMTAPNAAPKNIADTDPTLLANLGLLPFASEESAPMPVTVNVRTVVVRSGIASFRTAAFRVPIASAVKAIIANKRQGISPDDAGKQVSADLKTQYPDWPNTNAAGFVKSVYAERQ